MFSPANERQEGVETYAQRVGGGQSQLEGGTQLKGGRHSWRMNNLFLRHVEGKRKENNDKIHKQLTETRRAICNL
uniref:Uncharacterized protein n=1 Tax=Rhodnius prolixus TaxID=13249 RepID=T1HH47_RHOPR